MHESYSAHGCVRVCVCVRVAACAKTFLKKARLWKECNNYKSELRQGRIQTEAEQKQSKPKISGWCKSSLVTYEYNTSAYYENHLKFTPSIHTFNTILWEPPQIYTLDLHINMHIGFKKLTVPFLLFFS